MLPWSNAAFLYIIRTEIKALNLVTAGVFVSNLTPRSAALTRTILPGTTWETRRFSGGKQMPRKEVTVKLCIFLSSDSVVLCLQSSIIHKM